MRLKLENIGIIEEADIRLDGLTVIAGENDSGKSTVGKVLYSLIKTLQYANKYIGADGKSEKREPIKFNEAIKEVFNAQISENSKIEFDEDFLDDEYTTVTIKDDICTDFISPKNYSKNRENKYRAILIETPFIWNIFLTLKTIKNMKESGELANFNVSPITKDLHLYLSQPLNENNIPAKPNIESIIQGAFQKDIISGFTFNKNNTNIELTNTAMDIKYFGILQVLSDNNYFFEDQILRLNSH